MRGAGEGEAVLTGSVGNTRHAHATQMAPVRPPPQWNGDFSKMGDVQYLDMMLYIFE